MHGIQHLRYNLKLTNILKILEEFREIQERGGKKIKEWLTITWLKYFHCTGVTRVNLLSSSLYLFVKTKIAVKLVAWQWKTVCQLNGEAI